MFRTLTGGAVFWVVAAGVQPPSTAPAPGDSEAQLEQCMRHCRDTFTSVEIALRMIERVQASHDPVQLNGALRAVGGELIVMRGQMSECLRTLEQARNPARGAVRPALLAQLWACPMHSQVRQDRPGNCPLCDATLRPVSDGGVPSTRPLAASPERKAGTAPGPLRSTAGR